MALRLDRLEFTAPDDQYFNYCWWKYAPIASPAGKLRPVSLLFHSFDVAGIDPQALTIVERLRQALGPFRTVWGAKWFGDRLGWEFYFYDYKRREREVSMTRVLAALAELAQCDIAVNEHVPYFMFSLDIDSDLVAGRRDLDVIHMYVGNPGSTVSSGIVYGIRRDAVVLENLYFFFDARRQLQDAAAKVLCSPHAGTGRMRIDRVLWPELRTCQTLCVANKQHNDTIYFSGVNVRQLLFFLTALKYPPPIIRFVEEHEAKLDHLLYDVGFDYVAEGDAIRVLKSGYYGVF